MHATTKQLLSLRDQEPVAVDVQQHVDGCALCQQTLRQLQSVQSVLQKLAQDEAFAAATDGAIPFAPQWERVKQGAKAKARQRQRIGQWTVAASFAIAIIASLPFIKLEKPANNENLVKSAQLTPKQKQARLIARNAQLENALRELPQAPKVMRGEAAYAIATFEDQIALVDYELSYGAEMGVDDVRSVNLLQNRADLLGSLYKLRYTQAMANIASY